MAKPKLFPERPKPDDQNTREPHERFNDLAGKVFSAPKAKIEERERAWQHDNEKTSRAREQDG